MPTKDEINQEIARLQERMDIYTNAGELEESGRISEQIEDLLRQLR